MRNLPAVPFVSLVLVWVACPRPPDAPPDAGFRVVLEGLPAPLLSASAAPDGVLVAVGGKQGRALALRWDSQGAWEQDVGTPRALWWVHAFSSSDVLAVGDQGTIVAFDGERWRAERAGGDFTLYGVWGATRDEVWAVGGNPTASFGRPVVLRRRGGAWGALDVSASGAKALFKVWGSSPSDVWMVGDEGFIGRWDGQAFTAWKSPTRARLVTVHGRGPDEVYAVGGMAKPAFLRFDGKAWTELSTPEGAPALNGVAVDGRGELLLAGLYGFLAQGRSSALELTPPLTNLGLHAVASLPEGQWVAVGGDLFGVQGAGLLLSTRALSTGPLRRWPHDGVPIADAGVDAGLDGGRDGGFDAGADAGRDGGFDAGRDGGTDAGVDAGVDGGAPPSDGGLGPGAPCDSAPSSCTPPLDCWLVFGPFVSYCTAACSSAQDCGAYGPGACCQVPGPQTTTSVCIVADAGVCRDGG